MHGLIAFVFTFFDPDCYWKAEAFFSENASHLILKYQSWSKKEWKKSCRASKRHYIRLGSGKFKLPDDFPSRPSSRLCSIFCLELDMVLHKRRLLYNQSDTANVKYRFFSEATVTYSIFLYALQHWIFSEITTNLQLAFIKKREFEALYNRFRYVRAEKIDCANELNLLLSLSASTDFDFAAAILISRRGKAAVVASAFEANGPSN